MDPSQLPGLGTCIIFLSVQMASVAPSCFQIFLPVTVMNAVHHLIASTSTFTSTFFSCVFLEFVFVDDLAKIYLLMVILVGTVQSNTEAVNGLSSFGVF